MKTRLFSIVLGSFAGLLMAFAVENPVTSSPMTLMSDSNGKIQEISIHYVPEFHESVFETFEDLFGCLDNQVCIQVVVESLADYENFLAALSLGGMSSLNMVPLVTECPISPWSKDRYGTFMKNGRALLAVPSERAAMTGRRGNDEKVPSMLCNKNEYLDMTVMPFRFEGGDLIADDCHIFIAANLLSRNFPEDVDNRAALINRIVRSTDRQPVILGQTAKDVPDHHIGMYLTPLGNNKVAMADPDLGRDLHDQLGLCYLDLERNGEKYEPFRRAITEVETQGFKVIRVPMLLTTIPRVYVTYNNAIVETDSGQQRIYMPSYDLPELDSIAQQIFENAGLEVFPVRVGRVYRNTGSLRCLVGIISRIP